MPITEAARPRLVFPLDVPSLEEASEWMGRLRAQVGCFKVGLQLFTAAGPAAVRAVHQAGSECFLDLKLHDIPATMAHAAEAAAGLGVRLLTVHTAAGPRALEACARAVEGTETSLLGVTVLTSMDAAELSAIGAMDAPEALVLRRAHVATQAGLRGLVCSAHECAAIREALGSAPELVVPGIRPEGSPGDDQRRAATPAEAIRLGADRLVVGRPIRQAADPVAAAVSVLRQIQGAS
ncbi:MAG: orotidine-5'-phosphate decarboxylase [Myxococcales bacterium]|nr:orotidine-5'-phosphate decarboxylase [Myxococcales bacterium]